MKTISIAAHTMVNPKLARIMVVATGDISEDDLHEAIVDQLDGQGAPVADSFHKVEETPISATYVGFAKSVPQVRSVTSQELVAGYSAVMASNSNALISKSDQSIWELKEGPAGKYLVRAGDEDLSTLITASLNHYAAAPRLSNIVMPMPNPNNLVAYVTADGDMDYGFVTRTSSIDQVAQVVSPTSRTARNVPVNMVTAAYEIEIEPEVHQLAAANVSPAAKDQMTEYYTTLFSYAPDYLAKVIDMIND